MKSSLPGIDDYFHPTLRVDTAWNPGNYPFPNRIGKNKPLTTRHHARLMNGWPSQIGLDPALYGTHSLRRTKVALIYRRTGNRRAVQLLPGRTKLESTVRNPIRNRAAMMCW
jgi:hypothetical protein